jgi:NTE family protein
MLEDPMGSTTGLVLTGGGARAAYQVGAIQALAEITRLERHPFPILVGMSAGAINATALAAGADDFPAAAARLGRIWSVLTPDRIYRTDAPRLAAIGIRWMRDLTTSGIFGENTINYLLDTAPLRRLLEAELRLDRLPVHFRSGALRGVAVSATNYLTGTGVTFFDGDPLVAPWARSLRVGMREPITVDHVMGSAAIPLFFPPIQIDGTYFGDGCIRMLAPVSPAIHLGADRIVAIGVRHKRSAEETARRQLTTRHGSLPLAEIIGALMNALFLDSLELDTERLERINQLLDPASASRPQGQHLRVVPLLVLRPSEDLGDLAEDEQVRLPAALRYLLQGIGAGHRGKDLLSYLAFESVYVRRLISLGHRDTWARRSEIEEFLRAPARDAPEGSSVVDEVQTSLR